MQSMIDALLTPSAIIRFYALLRFKHNASASGRAYPESHIATVLIGLHPALHGNRIMTARRQFAWQPQPHAQPTEPKHVEA